MAVLSPTCSVPVRVPGGKPVMETPVVPRSPLMEVKPALVIPALPLRAPNGRAKERFTVWERLLAGILAE